MLEYLHIKNVALIEDSEINFGDGLNILSGETGAGKSMVIDSVNFALGERINKDFIRNGASQAVVEALFVMKDSITKELNIMLEERGIIIENDNSLLISRILNSSGKSVCRINGSTATTGMIKLLSEALIDIHGQHEHQSLLNPSKHILLLDKFCGEDAEECKKELTLIYNKYKQVKKDLNSLSGDERERAKKIDLLQFQMNEISDAKLKIDEEEILQERKKILGNGEKITRLSTQSLELLYEGEGEGMPAIDQIAKAISYMRDLSDIDDSTRDIYDTLESVYAQIDDITREIKKYADRIETDPNEVDEVEERLNLIYNLKRKYGNNIESILEYYDEISKEAEFISGSEETIAKLTVELDVMEHEMFSICSKLSEIRKSKASVIEKEIVKQLEELEMKSADFKISIEKKSEFTGDGWDKVEFLISANLGEELKPLAKIASGGEMSRVMLALKGVLADVDNIETFIFDEIDTGVSGRTAQKVAEKMSVIGKTHQIICITHLPQIAAMADSHYLIEKNSQDNKTTTNVYNLDNEKSVEEIARLMGGAKITDATLKAAEEMKVLAEQIKSRKQ